MSEVFEKDLLIKPSLQTGDYVRIVDSQGVSKQVPGASLTAPSGVKGLAYLATDPGTPTANDAWLAMETGTFTNFGGVVANAQDYLVFDGTTWGVAPRASSEYRRFLETDPSLAPTPSAGAYFVGTFKGRLWVKDSQAHVEYYINETDLTYQSQAQARELNFRQRIVDDGGDYFPNPGARAVAKLQRLGLWRKTQLLLTPAGVKSGTGVGDGKLYSIKGSDFTVSRNSTKSYIDPDGFIRKAAVDTATISFKEALASIETDRQSTNQLLYWKTFEGTYYAKTNLDVRLDPSTAGSELVVNGDMELDSDWLTAGTPDVNERSNVQANSGTYSRHIVVTDGTYSGIKQSIPTQAGKSYLIEGYIYVVSGEVRVELSNGSNKKISVNTGFEKVSLYTNTQIDNDNILIRSAGVNAEFYVDDVSIKEVQPYASPFKDDNGNIVLQSRRLYDTVDSSAVPHMLKTNGITITGGNNVSYIAIVKKGTSPFVELFCGLYGDATTYQRIFYNFDTDSFSNISTGVVSYKSNKLADGNVSIEFTVSTTLDVTSANGVVQLMDNSSNYNYQGDGTGYIEVPYLQLEEGEPTGIICAYDKAENQLVTRLTDIIYQNGDVTGVDYADMLLNDTNVAIVLDAEIDWNNNDFTYLTSIGGVGAGGGNPGLSITKYNYINKISFEMAYSSTLRYRVSIENPTAPKKLAILFDKSASVIKGFVDGVLVASTAVSKDTVFGSDLLNRFRFSTNSSTWAQKQGTREAKIVIGATEQDCIDLTK